MIVVAYGHEVVGNSDGKVFKLIRMDGVLMGFAGAELVNRMQEDGFDFVDGPGSYELHELWVDWQANGGPNQLSEGDISAIIKTYDEFMGDGPNPEILAMMKSHCIKNPEFVWQQS